MGWGWGVRVGEGAGEGQAALASIGQEATSGPVAPWPHTPAGACKLCDTPTLPRCAAACCPAQAQPTGALAGLLTWRRSTWRSAQRVLGHERDQGFVSGLPALVEALQRLPRQPCGEGDNRGAWCRGGGQGCTQGGGIRGCCSGCRDAAVASCGRGGSYCSREWSQGAKQAAGQPGARQEGAPRSCLRPVDCRHRRNSQGLAGPRQSHRTDRVVLNQSLNCSPTHPGPLQRQEALLPRGRPRVLSRTAA